MVAKKSIYNLNPKRQKELDKLSAFSDFIDSLDLDDLGKGPVQKK